MQGTQTTGGDLEFKLNRLENSGGSTFIFAELASSETGKWNDPVTDSVSL